MGFIFDRTLTEHTMSERMTEAKFMGFIFESILSERILSERVTEVKFWRVIHNHGQEIFIVRVTEHFLWQRRRESHTNLFTKQSWVWRALYPWMMSRGLLELHKRDTRNPIMRVVIIKPDHNMSFMSPFDRSTDPWLCGWRALPLTITKASQTSLISGMTWAVNSVPLSLLSIDGAPRREIYPWAVLQLL